VIGAGGVTTGNDAVLLAGLTDGPPRIAAREGAKLVEQPSLAIRQFLAIDGSGAPGAPVFFTALLRGSSVTLADDLALCAALPDKTVRLLARKGQAVGEKKIAILATLAGEKGTLAANRWRAGDDAIGVRLTFTDRTHALYTIPATATGPDQWLRWTSSGDSFSTGENAPLIRSFGLPGFGTAGPAAVANLQLDIGGVTTLDEPRAAQRGCRRLHPARAERLRCS
jgi:hypothetical protein